MELNRYELETILQALRNEGMVVGKQYILSLKEELNKTNYNKDDIGIYTSNTALMLQRFNNLIIKIEDELGRRV